MINTTGLSQYAIISALEYVAGRKLWYLHAQNGVEIGQNRLFDWMRQNGFLIRRQGTDYNMPTQKAMELGLFEIKETSVVHSAGNVTINKTPKVTGKGQVYFINQFLDRKEA